MSSLSERIQAEAAAERELSASLLHYAEVRHLKVSGERATVDSLSQAIERAWRAEAACKVQRHDWQGCEDRDTSLGALCQTGEIGKLANAVRRVGARRAYECLRANTLDNIHTGL